MIHCRNNGGTKRAMIGGRKGFILGLLPSKVLRPSMMYILNSKVIVSLGRLSGRVTRVEARSMSISPGGLGLSAETAVSVP